MCRVHGRGRGTLPLQRPIAPHRPSPMSARPEVPPRDPSPLVPLRGPGLVPLVRALVALLVAGFASCAAPDSDIHLAPLYTRANTADAAVEQEALGGFWLRRTNASDGALQWTRYGPLYSTSPPSPDPETGEPREGYLSYYLVPLGQAKKVRDESSALLFPLFIAGRKPDADGVQTFQLAALPGLLLESSEAKGTQFGIFPLWGRFKDFLTFDRLVFIAWPLFVYAERSERVSYHFLWPFVGWTSGGGEHSFRIFPLYSHTRWKGRFDRYFFLWPFFHYQRNHLGGGGEEPETKWMFWPFLGHTERGTFDAWTVLWPFFGYSRDPRSGFWAFDGPWPLVRFQRGPDGVSRSRVWPFYSHTVADGLDATSFLWPIIQFRHEVSETMRRDGAYVIPFWQSWDRIDLESGETSAWRKLFPLFQYEREGSWERGSFPTLDPFWRNQLIDRHYAWMWKLWEWENGEDWHRERAWLGLYRRERGLGEDRRSLTGLWSSRRYRDESDRAVKETSLLFGLVRWRVTKGGGFAMLMPAFPGPGWPAHGAGHLDAPSEASEDRPAPSSPAP